MEQKVNKEKGLLSVSMPYFYLMYVSSLLYLI